MTTDAERAAIAEALWEARTAGTTTPPPSKRAASFGLEDAYAVGALLHARRCAADERQVGVKIGFTNTAVWESLGLADPICAPLYDDTVLDAAALPGGAIDVSRFVAPGIEPEVVLGLGESRIEWWALGFEIVQVHYPEWQMTAADALADYGLHAALIVGPRQTGELRDFEIELLRDGVLCERASTTAVLGGPLRALDRAMTITTRTKGLVPPHAGEIVTTGSMTSVPRIAPGETWEVRAVGVDIAPVRVRLT
jgi:2-oxo-3-hexenedioate decarboxylase